ncbi:hypothetical protein D3C87_1845910 [compost metagenome]
MEEGSSLIGRQDCPIHQGIIAQFAGDSKSVRVFKFRVDQQEHGISIRHHRETRLTTDEAMTDDSLPNPKAFGRLS